jgi:ParB/RepB/Spo0J family partition protein
MNSSAPAVTVAHHATPLIPLGSIVPSKLNPRKNFNAQKLEELANSIKARGVLQPILVRPINGKGTFEIVAGERRWRAAKIAGLAEIPANSRTLTDAEALECTVIENNQRSDLHSLEEAEGFEALLKCKHSDGRVYTADDIAAKIARSKSYVYQKLKLCELCEPARKAFYAGDLDFSRAILIARIHGEALQKKALAEIGGERMGARDAQNHVQRNYMLSLERAPFPIKDATLHAKAGGCDTCQKRTGAQPELFMDIKSGDVCTDPVCFGEKRAANSERAVKIAKEKGIQVITGAEAKKIAPYGARSSLYGYESLEHQVHVGSGKYKPLSQVLGKDAPPSALLQDPSTGDLIEVVKASDAKKILAAKVKDSAPAREAKIRKQQRAQEERQKRERELRKRIYFAGRDHVAKQGIGLDDLRVVVSATWGRLWNDHQKAIAPWWVEREDKRGRPVDRIAALEREIKTMKSEDLIRLLMDCTMVHEIHAIGGLTSKGAATVEAFAKRHGVNLVAVKREAVKERSAAPKAKAAQK